MFLPQVTALVIEGPALETGAALTEIVLCAVPVQPPADVPVTV